MPKESETLKVMLSKDATKRVREHAKKNASTPPRIVNKVLLDNLPKK